MILPVKYQNLYNREVIVHSLFFILPKKYNPELSTFTERLLQIVKAADIVKTESDNGG